MLPLLCLSVLNKNHAFVELKTKDFYAWDPGLYERTNGEVGFKEPNPPRKYLTIELDSDRKSNDKKLLLFQTSAHNLVASGDTINGVHLHFGKKASFKTLVEAIDLLDIADVYLYSFYKSDIWVWNTNYFKSENLDSISEDYARLGPCIPTYQPNFDEIENGKETERITRNEFIKESIVKYYPSGILFLVLCALAFFQQWETGRG